MISAPLILWCDGGHDAAENMRRDAALLARLEAADPREGQAVLRLFTFDPPGITLGHAQRPERTLDLDRCRAAGVVWAVRPTGGRAIYHDREWTYSLAARLDDPTWGGSLSETYARVSRLIHAALVRLGVPAALAVRRRWTSPDVAGRRGAADASPAWATEVRSEDRSAACFASTARHEIVLGGGKLVGSAQRRTRSALLQQGSILLGRGHERLAEFLACPAAEREREREMLQRAAMAGAFVGEQTPLATIAEAITLELKGSVRRHDGPAGRFLLTSSKTGSYTRPFTQSIC